MANKAESVFDVFEGNGSRTVFVEESVLILYTYKYGGNRSFEKFYTPSEVAESIRVPGHNEVLLRFTDGFKLALEGDVDSEKLKKFLNEYLPEIPGFDEVKLPEVKKVSGAE